MILQAYSIYDRKGLLYHAPFFAPTDGAAVRMLSDLVADATSTISRHPNDYVLYGIGTYSDSNGSLEPNIPLRHVMDASSLVPPTTPTLFDDAQRREAAANMSNGAAVAMSPSQREVALHNVGTKEERR